MTPESKALFAAKKLCDALDERDRRIEAFRAVWHNVGEEEAFVEGLGRLISGPEKELQEAMAEMPPAFMLTGAQTKHLRWLADAPRGVLEFVGGGSGDGLTKRAWGIAMSALCDFGFATPYVHGGYEITDAGRTLMAKLTSTED